MKARVIASFLSCALLAGCAHSFESPNSPLLPKQSVQSQPYKITSLADTRWILTDLDGQAVLPSSTGWATPGLDFAADAQSVSGFSGVNRFGGRYSQDGGLLTFGPFSMTRRAGPPELMQIESQFTRILSGVTGWRQRGADIELIAGNKVGVVLTPVVEKR